MDNTPSRFTYSQGLVLFWYLTGDPQCAIWQKHWLRSHAQQACALDPQVPEVERFKGWFFWLFINNLNTTEIMLAFQGEAWSPSKDHRWYGRRLIAWGWNRPSRDEPRLLLDFIEDLLKIIPQNELQLAGSDPKVAQLIKVPGWTLLPARDGQGQDFNSLERHATALLGRRQSFPLVDNLGPNVLVDSLSPGPYSVVGHLPPRDLSQGPVGGRVSRKVQIPEPFSPHPASSVARRGNAQDQALLDHERDIAALRNNVIAELDQFVNHGDMQYGGQSIAYGNNINTTSNQIPVSPFGPSNIQSQLGQGRGQRYDSSHNLRLTGSQIVCHPTRTFSPCADSQNQPNLVEYEAQLSSRNIGFTPHRMLYIQDLNLIDAGFGRQRQFDANDIDAPVSQEQYSTLSMDRDQWSAGFPPQ